MRKTTILSTIVIVIAALPVVAQTPAPSPSPVAAPAVSEYVEVVATRIPEPAEEVPASIEVITGEELRDRGATDLRSALALAAGLDVAPGGDAGPANFVPEFWGLKEADAFLLVVDGVPWGGAFNPAVTTLDLDGVERIEVLRGAAPVMYGATSFVGVIHVVHSDAAAYKGSASLSGGSYGSGSGHLGAPLPSWAGFESAVSLDVSRQGFKDDRTEWGRGQLLWRNSRALGSGHFRFDLSATWLDQDPASPHPREGGELSAAVPLDANHNPEDAFIDDRRFQLSTGYDKKVGSADWSTSLSFSKSKNEQFRGFLADLEEPIAEARGFREDISGTDIYFDTHFAWTGSSHFKFVTGFDHLHGEGEAKGETFDYGVPLDGSAATIVAEPEDLPIGIGDRREFSGLYGFVEWNPTSRWRLEGGLRLNRTFERREGEVADEPAAGEEGEEEVENTRLSGSAALSFLAWESGHDRVRLFANYRNTYKPAAIDFGLGEAEGEEEGEGILEPETADSFEIGAKSRFFENRLSLEVAAFQMDFNNLVLSQVVGGLPGLINAGKERFKGVEAAAAWHMAGHVSARATYSFHDAKFRDFVTEFDGVPTQLEGKRLEMSARHLFSAGLLRAPEHGVLAAAEVNWVGSRYLNKRNTALADAYATFSAGLGYRADKWEFRLDGRNLNDARDPVAESELGDAQYYRMTARRFDLTVARRF
jgi:outer membrane receptor protein involved in Fe transport